MAELNVAFRPELKKPVLICAFRGWNDGGQGASLSGGYLAKLWGAERFAEIDCEGFYDFQATRPHVSLVEGMTRRIDWPENAFFHAAIPGADRDAVLLLGVEPSLRWRTFTELVLGLAKDLGVELVVTFGSLLADVPHTRPAPVTGAATDPELVQSLGLEPSRYEGPTGIVGIVHDACREAGIPSVSLWSAVPHYVSLAPSPRAALALVRRFGELLQVEIDLSELEEASEEYSEQVTEAVSTDAETTSYVEELERRVDMLAEEDDLPSGETLAAELTRYLRERDQEDEGSDGPTAPRPDVIRVCVAGVTGWTGTAVADAVEAADDLELVAGVSRSSTYRSVAEALAAVETDVVVDYTSAEAVKANVLAALDHNVAVVVGSSGLTAEDYAEIDERARAAGVGVIAAGNFSVLAALLLRSATEIARHVPAWEILDYASAGKPDVPSGTSRELAERLGQAAVGRPLDELVGPREARGATVAGTQIHSLRLPSFVVSTEILFAAEGERLSIRHDAGESPAPYAAGTLLAVRRVVGLVGLTRGLDSLLA